MLFCHSMTASEAVNSFCLRVCHITVRYMKVKYFSQNGQRFTFWGVNVRNFTSSVAVCSNEECPSMATLFIYGDHVIATMTENEKLTELLLRCLTHSLQVQCQGYSEVVGTLESYLL